MRRASAKILCTLTPKRIISFWFCRERRNSIPGSMARRFSMQVKNNAVVLPAGCYYQFRNSGTDPLVMARIGAGQDKADQRLNPDGATIPGRSHEQGAAKPVLIEGAFFE